MNKGQITIAAVIMGLGAMALTAFGFYTASNVRTDNKIGGVQKETATVSERTAKLEATIQVVLPAIDKRLENIEKALRIK